MDDLPVVEVEIDGNTKDLELLWVRVELAEEALYMGAL